MERAGSGNCLLHEVEKGDPGEAGVDEEKENYYEKKNYMPGSFGFGMGFGIVGRHESGGLAG
jgi:hypothetical protein